MREIHQSTTTLQSDISHAGQSRSRAAIAIIIGAMLVACLGLMAGCGSEKTQTVSLKVDASAAAEKGLEKEGLFYNGEVEIPEKGSVKDALDAADIVYTASGDYVSGVFGIGNGAYGPSSGWIYTVNGEFVMESYDKIELAAGDKIEFKYITEYVE